MNKKTTTETKNISFKIDAKLHKRVKKYCEKNNITIKDYIINYFDISIFIADNRYKKGT